MNSGAFEPCHMCESQGWQLQSPKETRRQARRLKEMMNCYGAIGILFIILVAILAIALFFGE